MAQSPAVAESERLPWVTRSIRPQPQRGCVLPRTTIRHNPVGVEDDFDSFTQGSSCLATAGLDDSIPLGLQGSASGAGYSLDAAPLELW